MATKSLLLAVADTQASGEIAQALGPEWEIISVAAEVEVLEQLEKRPFDALLLDFNLGSPDASDLLNQALEKRPETARFLSAYEADLALVAAKVQGTPHILPKPIDLLSVKSRLESATSDSAPSEAGNHQPVSDVEASTVPPVYSEVLKALGSPGVTNEQLGEIIAGDETLTSEVLRLTNSSYLGLPGNITDPVEAVESLGQDVLKALVMALQFLAEHGRLKPAYLSVDKVWQHSVKVGQIARDLVLFETKDRALASQALVAGLLHDLGKVVLATNFDDLYGRVHSLARKQPVTLWSIEKEMFGANHGEIGACLIGMWNLPIAIVDAAALHHEPCLGETQELTPLAAVHIANVIERELQSDNDDMMAAAVIDTTFLNQLGLLQRLPIWRATFANCRAVNADIGPESTKSAQPRLAVFSRPSTRGSRTANQLPGPVTATQTTSSGFAQPGDPSSDREHNRMSWIYAGAAAVVVLLALWFRTQPAINQAEPAYARTPAPGQAPAALSPETAAPVASQPTPAVVAPEESPASTSTVTPTGTAVPVEKLSKPVEPAAAPEPTVAAASPVQVPQATVTNVAPASTMVAEKSQPEFRINAIIYSSTRPSAILNGQTVYVGDQLNGAKVLSIGRTTVTLQLDGQRKTYELR